MIPVPGLTIEQQPESVLRRMLVWGEARGEPPDGKLAVLWVARNRADRNKTTMAIEILRPWQFSAFNANDPNRPKMLDAWKNEPRAWADSEAVCGMFESGMVADPTGGATHYCTLTLNGKPLWNSEPVGKVQWYHRPEIEAGRTVFKVQIGRHVFAVAP